MKDDAEQSNPSTGSVGEPIDVEELLCELHHISGSERIDVDVRRVACDAESAIERLRAWVNELQMNTSEREAVERAISREMDAEYYGGDEPPRVVALRGLLERHK